MFQDLVWSSYVNNWLAYRFNPNQSRLIKQGCTAANCMVIKEKKISNGLKMGSNVQCNECSINVHCVIAWNKRNSPEAGHPIIGFRWDWCKMARADLRTKFCRWPKRLSSSIAPCWVANRPEIGESELLADKQARIIHRYQSTDWTKKKEKKKCSTWLTRQGVATPRTAEVRRRAGGHERAERVGGHVVADHGLVDVPQHPPAHERGRSLLRRPWRRTSKTSYAFHPPSNIPSIHIRV